MARPPILLISGFVILGGLLGTELWRAHASSPASCTSVEAMDKLHLVLRDRYGLDSTLVNNVQTVSGGMFAPAQHCSAEIAEIRDNISAEDLPWRGLDYDIVRDGVSGRSVVAAELGGSVKLAAPAPSLWQRLRARL